MEEDVRRAFNRGSDDRLQGRPATASPYRNLDYDGSEELRKAWRRGWWDAHENWGRWARWPIRGLPGVKDV